MNELEYKAFTKAIEKNKKRLTKDKDAATEYLIKLKLFTAKGNRTKRYRNVCIPEKQA